MGLSTFEQSSPTAPPPSAAERYLNHLNAIFQKEPLLFKEESLLPGIPGVTAIIYKDIPEPGYITGFTYGLSLVEHPDWKFGRPELSITVQSEHLDWAQSIAFMANHLRGDCPFTYGETIHFGEPIHEESTMDAFFIFAPAILEKTAYLHIDLDTGYKINIAGVYPLYSGELNTYHNIGLEKFWHHQAFDPFDVKRAPINPETPAT